MTPYYEDVASGITIYHGDCIEVMPAVFPSVIHGDVDLVVTSPPYNMGLVPGGNGRGMYRPGASNKAGRFREGYSGLNDDARDQSEYDDWQRAALAEIRPRVEHGRLRMPLGMDFGIPLRQIIIWDRGTGIDVNLRNYCTRQEWVLLFAKPEFMLISHSASGGGDVWRLGMEYLETGHPAPFPLSLPTRVLLTTGAESVLDPFMGSGTTLRAAKNMGRRAIGIEIEERYCEIAAKRLSQTVMFGAEVA